MFSTIFFEAPVRALASVSGTWTVLPELFSLRQPMCWQLASGGTFGTGSRHPVVPPRPAPLFPRNRSLKNVRHDSSTEFGSDWITSQQPFDITRIRAEILRNIFR